MTERDDWAWRYFKRRWNVVVLCEPQHHCDSPGKVPAEPWRDWQHQLRSALSLQQALRRFPRGNLGVVLGEVSGLTAVDVDSRDAFEWLDAHTPDTLNMACFFTGRGLRFLFRYDPEFPSGVIRPALEVLNDGRQSVMPPSQHHTGFVYRWVCEEPLTPIPQAWRAWIRRRSSSLSVWPVGTRNDRLFRIACSLRRWGVRDAELETCVRVLNGQCEVPLPEVELRNLVRGVVRRYEPGS